MFTKVERLISLRNLKPKKKEGFLKLISIFSFLGIMLGVAVLIIVMSVMNGFRTDLTNKILGLNPHITVQPNGSIIDEDFKKSLTKIDQEIKISEVYSGEGIVLAKNNAKGLIIKGIKSNEIKNSFIKQSLIEGKYIDFEKGTTFIGAELAYNLELTIGDKVNILSSSFIQTPFGSIPKQENFIISGIFNSGFQEFDQNLILINLNDALSIFDKTKKDINLEIYLKKPLEADYLKKEIKLLNDNYFIFSWGDLNKSFFGALKVERNVMFIILTLIIIVAAFNIISGLTILIKNKTKEIAILKTLGLSNKSIVKSFFLTGFVIGLTATIAGLLLGILFAVYIEPIRILLSNILHIEIFPQDIYFLEKMPSEIDPISILVIFFLSLTTTTIASLIPAAAITKMNTIQALKYE